MSRDRCRSLTFERDRANQDPEMRRLAEEIISAQGREIAFMTEWLAKTAK
ncbi:DUF305 domain-containing protein [Salipiger thiooxidans]|nr:DUF305 domain-containing protein [Salipiger thiooxidans]